MGSNVNAETREVTHVFVHPEFDEETVNFDVALLKLSSPLPINERIRTICAPPSDMNFAMGLECYVTGWGSSSDNNGNGTSDESYSGFIRDR